MAVLQRFRYNSIGRSEVSRRVQGEIGGRDFAAPSSDFLIRHSAVRRFDSPVKVLQFATLASTTISDFQVVFLSLSRSLEVNH